MGNNYICTELWAKESARQLAHEIRFRQKYPYKPSKLTYKQKVRRKITEAKGRIHRAYKALKTPTWDEIQ